MKAKLFVASVVFICFTLWSSISFAACPNVVGIWNFTGNIVIYDDVNNNFSYTKATGTFHVKNQKGCLFYGAWEGPSNKKFTGAILGTQITFSDKDWLFSSQLRNLDPATGQYKAMSATGSTWDSDASFSMTMTRQ
jgi:hypothetical protein